MCREGSFGGDFGLGVVKTSDWTNNIGALPWPLASICHFSLPGAAASYGAQFEPRHARTTRHSSPVSGLPVRAVGGLKEPLAAPVGRVQLSTENRSHTRVRAVIRAAQPIVVSGDTSARSQSEAP